MALDQSVSVTIEGGPEGLRVTRVRVTERIHAPYRLELSCAALASAEGDAPLIADEVIGQPARVAWALPDGGERAFEGVVDSVHTTPAGCTLVVVPRLALLEDCVDHVVFLEKDAVEIATLVLSEHGITVEARVLRTLPKRPQCVQLFESDLAFVTRILAEEGVVAFLPLDDKDKLVFADQSSGFDDVPGLEALPVVEHGGMESGESLYQLRLEQRMVSDKATLRDYFFEKPNLDLEGDAVDGDGVREVYEYPGVFSEPDAGKELAGVRLAEARARRVVLRGVSSSRRLSPGYVVQVEGATVDALNVRWLVLEVEHELADQGTEAATTEERYVARFTAVPAEGGYRPPRRTPPRVGGVQTATVTAPSGVEIHTEAFGRSKVHLRWDRRRPLDDTSSAWARVLQPPTSGSMLQPRTGWEVVTGFHAASADAPWLLGRAYNGGDPPPVSLPGGKTSTMFGSMTTPGGGSANVVLFDDSAGSEKVAFTASKDFNERTENDKATEIKGDDTLTVGANRKVIVGQVNQVNVSGSQSYTVGASRTVNVDANLLMDAGSESVTVGGLRVFNVGGDYSTACASLSRLVGAAKVETAIVSQSRQVNGASTVLVGGSWKETGVVSVSVQVAGANAETVAGAKTINTGKYELKVRGALSQTLASQAIKASGKVAEDYKGPLSMKVGGSAKVKGADVTFEAKSKITLKASGITVTITSGGVKIDGKFDGSVSSAETGTQDYEG